MKPHKTYADNSNKFSFGSLYTSNIKGEWGDA